MEVIKRAVENIRRMWGNLTPTQRILLSASSVAMVALLTWGTATSAGNGWTRIAGAELDASARQRILKQFQDDVQRHEVRGPEIFVPKEDADRIVMELAGEGAMDDTAVWKFLEEQNIFLSKDIREQRYQRALEQKLTIMIRKIEAVKNASVVITPPSTFSTMGFAGDPGKATVQVELHEGRTLTNKNVIAIAGLVAKAVRGVKPDQVHIMDTKGNPYRAPGDDDHARTAYYWRDHEKAIEDEIAATIGQAFRGASIAVRLQARNSKIWKREAVRSNPKAVEEAEHKSLIKDGGAGAVPGIKGEEAFQPLMATGTPRSQTDSEYNAKYTVDEMVTETDDPAGQIEKITVGVLIPIEVGAEGTEMAAAEKELPKLTEWVLKAAGPQARAEDVSVQFLPSKRPEPVAMPALTERAYEWASEHWTPIALFALAFLGLVILWRLVRGAFPKDTVEELQALTAAITQSLETAKVGPAEIEVAGPEAEMIRTRQGIKDMVGKNPQTVAASLKGFMSGK